MSTKEAIECRSYISSLQVSGFAVIYKGKDFGTFKTRLAVKDLAFTESK